jgi:hypothetical protein
MPQTEESRYSKIEYLRKELDLDLSKPADFILYNALLIAAECVKSRFRHTKYIQEKINLIQKELDKAGTHLEG